MKENKPIGKISFEMDADVLQNIMNKGRLETFINTATSYFRRDLMTQLVDMDTSVATSLLYEDGEFGTPPGPHGPIRFQIDRIESLYNRIEILEQAILGGKAWKNY